MLSNSTCIVGVKEREGGLRSNLTIEHSYKHIVMLAYVWSNNLKSTLEWTGYHHESYTLQYDQTTENKHWNGRGVSAWILYECN